MIFDILFNQLSSYAIRDVEEYKNFCDRSKDQRPQPEEVIEVLSNAQETCSYFKCIKFLILIASPIFFYITATLCMQIEYLVNLQ